VVENLNFAVANKEIQEMLAKANAARAKRPTTGGGRPLDSQTAADLEEAYGLASQGKWLDASVLAKRLLDKNPESVRVLLLKGLLDTHMNFTDESIKTYGAVVLHDASEPEGHAGLGLAYARKKMWKEAAETLARAVKLRPDDSASQTSLGEALLALGRKDEALAALKEAVSLDDEDPQAWYLLGEAHLAMNDFGPAESALRRSVHIRPDNAMAFAHLGLAAFQNGRVEEAMMAANQALKMQPTLPDAYYVVGLVLHRTGRKEEAERVVTTLQNLDPKMAQRLLDAVKAQPKPPEEKKGK
jgi:tetratricopeptide (TPR) repeat protein